MVILGRIVRWKEEGIQYEADPKHRRLVLEYFWFDAASRVLAHNSDKEEKEEEGDQEKLDSWEAKEFRG